MASAVNNKGSDVATENATEGNLEKEAQGWGHDFKLLLGNPTAQAVSVCTVISTCLGYIGGPGSVDIAIRVLIKQGVAGVSGEVLASVVAPAIVSHIGKGAALLTGGACNLALLTAYGVISLTYRLITSSSDKSKEPEVVPLGIVEEPEQADTSVIDKQGE